MKTSELIGANLDYWVARADGYEHSDIVDDALWQPSMNWDQCGLLIEKYGIALIPKVDDEHGNDKLHKYCMAMIIDDSGLIKPESKQIGKNHLTAACRCIVASKYGDEVNDNEN